MAIMRLPVSLGEALDKLTILDIKLEKIADGRRQDVQTEYDALFADLGPYVQQHSYHYRLLKEVNLSIWNLQDDFHGRHDKDETAYARICRKILEENDRRFRLKKKINDLTASALKEQKGYAKKKAFLFTHIGLGDMFWMNGAVRWLSTAYDEVVVVCKKRYAENVSKMYRDDPSILIFPVEECDVLYPFREKRKLLEADGFDIYVCGQHKESARLYEFPHCFYDDLGLPRNIRQDYFHVEPSQEGQLLYDDIKKAAPEGRYVVIHQQSSQRKIPLAERFHASEDSRLILDLNENHYLEGHPFYATAEKVVNRPLLDYYQLLEGAEEIHMIESSIYCFATHLNLSKVKVKKCYFAHDHSNERLGVFETGTL